MIYFNTSFSLFLMYFSCLYQFIIEDLEDIVKMKENTYTPNSQITVSTIYT